MTRHCVVCQKFLLSLMVVVPMTAVVVVVVMVVLGSRCHCGFSVRVQLRHYI